MATSMNVPVTLELAPEIEVEDDVEDDVEATDEVDIDSMDSEL